MKIVGIMLCMGIFILQHGIATGADAPVSEATAECMDCHGSIHPGIVKDWQNSRHAAITPKGPGRDGLARKVSSKTVPKNLQNRCRLCGMPHSQARGPCRHVRTQRL